ncbi:hypothetical protein WME75_10750 [Sorangium sp. So ce1014]|uniref:hypothetical protein n=1 Tax=Sorangium sp. So ce1014 TaxID=3133326 RepID=UPI003F5EEF8B
MSYAGFRIGQFTSPLTSATTNSLLQDADPALHTVLAYYQAVLTTHLGARFDAEVTRAELPDLSGRISTLAIPYDPLPFLTQAQLTPPFLALFVVSERPSEKTSNWYHLEETWKLQWVLPPLGPAQYLQLYPFLRAVAKVILDRTEQGYDPTYQSGALVFNLAGIEEIQISEARYGSLQSLNTELFFPTVEMDLTVFERRMDAPGVENLTEIGGTISVADAEGSEDLIEFQEDVT